MGCCGSGSRQVTLKIQGMTCSHCQMSVEKALQGLAGVQRVKVDLEAKEAVVTYDPDRVTLQDLKEAVAQAGYEVIAP
ncbi:copper ion binding protein [Moorellaceae bacterium AZ2]